MIIMPPCIYISWFCGDVAPQTSFAYNAHLDQMNWIKLRSIKQHKYPPFKDLQTVCLKLSIVYNPYGRNATIHWGGQ